MKTNWTSKHYARTLPPLIAFERPQRSKHAPSHTAAKRRRRLPTTTTTTNTNVFSFLRFSYKLLGKEIYFLYWNCLYEIHPTVAASTSVVSSSAPQFSVRLKVGECKVIHSSEILKLRRLERQRNWYQNNNKRIVQNLHKDAENMEGEKMSTFHSSSTKVSRVYECLWVWNKQMAILLVSKPQIVFSYALN